MECLMVCMWDAFVNCKEYFKSVCVCMQAVYQYHFSFVGTCHYKFQYENF